MVLGLPAAYRAVFPGEIRTLAGADSGVLLAQQTAANLHAAPGDTITIGRAGLPPAPVTVAGIVDLPQADSLFQTVGAPAGAQPTAPPDNVVLMPDAQWHQLFDPLSVTRPDLVSTQIHVAAGPPAAAGPRRRLHRGDRARRTTSRPAAPGPSLVGDNLGAALDAARSDAAYAQVLFLFLGLPGAVLAALLTATVTSAGAARRRAEQALLRARGATARQLLGLAGGRSRRHRRHGCRAGSAGRRAGQPAHVRVATIRPDRRHAPWAWPAAAAASACSSPPPPCCCRRGATCASTPSPPGAPSVSRAGCAGWARLRAGRRHPRRVAALVFCRHHRRPATSWSWHPKGVPAISVSYWAFAGPALLWLGAALLTWRLADLLLGRGRACSPACCGRSPDDSAGTIAAGMSRQRRPLARAIVMLALAVAFAASTATFNATYRQQAEVDAQLTNGADVTVTPAPGAAMAPDTAAALAAVAGVRAVEPIQHRFAYIGADLQDLYGVRPATITGDRVAGHLLPPRHRRGADGHPGGQTGLHPGLRRNRHRLSASPRRPGERCGSSTPPPTNRDRSPSTTSGSSPSSPPPLRTVSSSPTPATSPRRPAPMRAGAFLVDTGGRDTAAVAARIRAAGGHLGRRHRHRHRPQQRGVESDRGGPRRADPYRIVLRPGPRRRRGRTGAGPWPC